MDLVYNTNKKFNHKRLIEIWEMLDTTQEQLCVTSNNLMDGIGALKNSGKTMYDYKDINPIFYGTYLEKVVHEVNDIVGQTYRVRFMNMKPRTTYRLHSDQGFRYHIPLITQKGCYFIVNDNLYEMQEVGYLYSFDGRHKHTAVNASLDNSHRLHLLFST
jgi:hypothetical protein